MHRMLKTWGEHSTWMDFTPVRERPAHVDVDDLPEHRHRHLPLADAAARHGRRRRPGRRRRGRVRRGRDLHHAEADPGALHPAARRLRHDVPGAGQGPRHRRCPCRRSRRPRLCPSISPPPCRPGSNGQANHGWFFEPTSSDGWDFETAEGKQPPALWSSRSPAPRWCSSKLQRFDRNRGGRTRASVPTGSPAAHLRPERR